MNLISYWNADKIVLRMYRATEVDASHPEPLIRNYVSDVLELAARANMPAPKIYVIDQDQPNAFATGRDPQHAAVAATRGLLGLLDRREIRGVMAHELAHVKNRDTLTMTITATIAGAVGALANFAFFFGGRDAEGRPANMIAGLAMMIIAPMAAGLVQMAISRAREYEADREGAEMSGDPQPWPRPCRRSKPTPRAATTTPTPSGIRPRRTCSSSTRWRAAAPTTCSRRTRPPRTACALSWR